MVSVLYDLREILFQGRGWERSGVPLLQKLLKIESINFYFIIEDLKKTKKHYPFLFQSKHFFLEIPLNRSIHSQPMTLELMKKIDVYHSLTEYPEFLFTPRTKLILSIHDCTPFKFPHFFNKNFVHASKKKYLSALKSASLIITFSHSVKKDLKKIFPTVKTKKIVLPHGHDHLPKVGLKKVHKKPYFLIVGGAEKDKNVEFVIDVYKNNSKINENYNLILVSPNPKKLTHKYKKEIIIYTKISDQKLASLYKFAAGLISPSLDEGFGFAPYEALSFGCPLILSRIKVYQNTLSKFNPIFFNPHSKRSLLRAWLKTIRNPYKVKPQTVNSWKETADKTYKLYLKK